MEFPPYFADVKMNHVRGSGAGAQIRASHSQSDPVSVGKNQKNHLPFQKLDFPKLTLAYLWIFYRRDLDIILTCFYDRLRAHKPKARARILWTC